MHIYRWYDNARARLNASSQELHSLPKLKTKKKWTKKIHPGISTFGESPMQVGPDHLKELIDHASKYVPEKQVADTPVFLMATAGVRLLPEMQRNALLAEICAYTRAHSHFSLPDCDLHIQTIPGETEGLYGWVAANYLLGGFDKPGDHEHGNGHHTYGFLDMGGASAQIAFAPNTTEATKHANDLKLLRMRTLDGAPSEYKVFVATWLGFGVNQARKRYVEALLESSPDVYELPDPCLPLGLRTTKDGEVVSSSTKALSNGDPILVGTGEFDECLRRTYPLLDKDAPCVDEPCLLHGQHVPAIDFNVNHFVGVSEFWHTTHSVFGLSHKDNAYDFNTYQRQVQDFCGQGWPTIEEGIDDHKWGKGVDEKIAREVCFKASWLISVLHDGIGIPRIGLEKVPFPSHNITKEVIQHAKEKGFLDPFQPVDKIEDTEVSWTLGKMVLYASGQVEPRSDSVLPVGFGSNIAGIPTDFQYAGSTYDPLPDSSFDEDTDDWGESADDLLHEAKEHSRSPHVFWGFAMLLTMLAVYWFRKRDRRIKAFVIAKNIIRKNTRRPGSPRKPVGPMRGFLGSKLAALGLGRGVTHYERVVEEGEASEFELTGVYDGTGELGNDDLEGGSYSDSSEGSRAGRSSGMATPKVNVIGGGNNGGFEPVGKYFEGGVGLGIHGVGIGKRTESSTSLGKSNTVTNAMDRSGLAVRTESRERLSPGLGLISAGRRSRNGSPTRKRDGLMSPVEEHY